MSRHCSSNRAAVTLMVAAALAASPLWGMDRTSKKEDACKTDQRVVVLDFKTSKLSCKPPCSCAPDAPLRPEEPVTFMIKGINPFRHAVTVKIKQVSFDALFQPPSLISDLMPKSSAGTAPKGGQGPLDSAFKTPEEELWNKLAAFRYAADELVLFENFAAEIRLWALLRDDVDGLITSSKGSATSLCQQIQLASTAGGAGATGRPVEKCATPEGLLRERAQINFEVEQRYREVAAAHTKLTKGTKEVEEAYSAEEQRHKTLVDNRAQIDQQFIRVIGLFAKIQEEGFGNLYFGPVAATGDQVEIVVDISLSPEAADLKLTAAASDKPSGDVKQTSAATSNKPNVKQKSATTPSDPLLVIPVIGRYRPSFSTGIFFTGLVDKKAQDSQTDRFSTALGAMVHTPTAYCWRNPDLSLHLSLGVALKDNNPVYVLGPSLIIGRQQRTVLTIGLAGGQVSRSSASTTTASTQTQTTPPKVFRTNFFFGLSYNFGATPSSDSTGTSAKK